MYNFYVSIYPLNSKFNLKAFSARWAWWYAPVIPATKEAEAGGL